jgi:hypothetical protein
MKRIYVCCPFRANEHGTQDENIEHARAVCERVRLLGHEPIVPHVLLSHIDEATDRARALNEGLKLLDSCAELWICSKHVTGGMLGEMQYANENGIKIVNRGGLI